MNTTVQFEIAAPRRETTLFHVVLDDDRIVGAVEGAAEDPDFTMVLAPVVFDEVVAGELPLDEAYMQGRVKVTGNVGRMLSVLPVLLSQGWLDAMSAGSPSS